MKTITKRKNYNVLIFYQILLTNSLRKCIHVCELAQSTAQISF